MTETTDIADPEPAPPAWETNRQGQIWAIVEIMGHKVRAGSISDAAIGGGVMLRIEHPTIADHDDAGPLTELYAQGAQFSIRPCSRAVATEWAENRWRQPITAVPALAELEAVNPIAYDDGAGIDEDDWDGEEYP